MPDNTREQLDAVLDRQLLAWRSGERPSVESLLSGTDFENDPEAEMDLLYQEILVQDELGLTPVPDEYFARYPHLREELSIHFEIHRAISVDTYEAEDDNGSFLRSDISPAGRSSSGPRIAHYEITSVLGEGAMAQVFQARDTRLGRLVALKVFRAGHLLTSRETSRLKTEAEAMARLSHSGIVRIYEIGYWKNAPYLALELAEKGTLAQRLQQFPFTPKAAAELTAELADAIHHAHTREIIHRDLKPANVLFSGDGRPMITDFGLARVVQERQTGLPDATRTGDTIGTPRYMAPEQASGRHDLTCPATDVYALGTLLFECLTGRAPFTASGVVETLQMIRDEDPPMPHRLQPGIPRDLETICLHCLQKRPAHRYPTAKALADDLRRFLRGEPILVKPVSTGELIWKWVRRHPTHASLIALPCIAAILIAAGVMIRSHQNQLRIRELKQEITGLIVEGRAALDTDDPETAATKFHQAWQKVQAEPALSDHEAAVSGWLDHSQKAVDRRHWQQRQEPKSFETRRDEALLMSLLLLPGQGQSVDLARRRIQSTLELTSPDDRDVAGDRDILIVTDSILVERQAGISAALELLNAVRNPSVLVQQRVAELYLRVNQSQASSTSFVNNSQLPPDAENSQLISGMGFLRNRSFRAAEQEFERVLEGNPRHFTARFFHGLCCLCLERAGEARVSMTACLAQNPEFLWSYFVRSLAKIQLGDIRSASEDLKAFLTNGRQRTSALQTLIGDSLSAGLSRESCCRAADVTIRAGITIVDVMSGLRLVMTAGNGYLVLTSTKLSLK